METKRKVAAATLALLLFISGMLIGLAISGNDSTPTFVIEENSMSVAASYIIGRCNSTHSYARNGLTGQIEHVNSSDVYTFAYARNKVYENGGGLIFVKAGTYKLSLSLAARSNVWWIGEGKSTVVYGSGSAYRRFYLGNNQTVLNMAFHYMCVTVNPYPEAVSNVKIENCWFLGNPLFIAVQLNIGNYNVSNIHVSDNYFVNYQTAIEIKAEGSGSTIMKQVMIAGNTILDCGAGIKVYDAAGHAGYTKTLRNLMIQGNMIADCTGNGTQLAGIGGADWFHVENVSICLNHIFNCGDYGIAIQNSQVYHAFIHGNYLHGNTDGAIYDAGTATTKTDNKGA